jgi:hypothetical protein
MLVSYVCLSRCRRLAGPFVAEYLASVYHAANIIYERIVCQKREASARPKKKNAALLPHCRDKSRGIRNTRETYTRHLYKPLVECVGLISAAIGARSLKNTCNYELPLMVWKSGLD